MASRDQGAQAKPFTVAQGALECGYFLALSNPSEAIRIERALPVTSPAYDRGDTEEQVKDRWRQYWRKLWEGVEE